MGDSKTKLGRVTQSLHKGGEQREGQIEMAEIVEKAITSKETAFIEAGTGTGKSFAYLTPVVDAKKKAVIATATIALQNQLLDQDLPQVITALETDTKIALLKGRNNYICNQKLKEFTTAKKSEQLDLVVGETKNKDMKILTKWAQDTSTGDKEDLTISPSPQAWNTLSIRSNECPGATRCPSGDVCFSEKARHKALAADVIVTNHHFYGLHIASGATLLPEHDVVVFDEAHQLPETLSVTCGAELSGPKLFGLARQLRRVLVKEPLVEEIDEAAGRLEDILEPVAGTTVERTAELSTALIASRTLAEKAIALLRKLTVKDGSDTAAKISRATNSATSLIDTVDQIMSASDDDVLWVDASYATCVLRLTPLWIGDQLQKYVCDDASTIFTSATMSDAIAQQLVVGETEVKRVGSPFDYKKAGLLYCATHLPAPSHKNFREECHKEILSLAAASKGRALCLFTSYSAMKQAHEAFEDSPHTLFLQGEMPKGKLIEAFKAAPNALLLATLSFWQGIDIPGPALSLVTIDRIPFPRPDEPVNQARRDKAGRTAFMTVDLPRAQILLAQAAGRLLRRQDDRGVVAVLDSRLATKKSYRWELIHALPPFTRTSNKQQVLDFLEELVA